MYKRNCLLLIIVALFALSCKPKGGKNYNKKANPDSPKTADTTQTADMPGETSYHFGACPLMILIPWQADLCP